MTKPLPPRSARTAPLHRRINPMPKWLWCAMIVFSCLWVAFHLFVAFVNLEWSWFFEWKPHQRGGAFILSTALTATVTAFIEDQRA